MGKAVLVIAATAFAPIALLCADAASAARSASARPNADECDERKSAPAASTAQVVDFRMPKPTIPKRKRRYIRM